MIRTLRTAGVFTAGTLFIAWLAGEVHGLVGTDEWLAFAGLAVLMAVVGTWATVREFLS